MWYILDIYKNKKHVNRFINNDKIECYIELIDLFMNTYGWEKIRKKIIPDYQNGTKIKISATKNFDNTIYNYKYVFYDYDKIEK